MKKMTYFVMALAMVLGLAQCRKEYIEPQNEGNVVMITLDVNGGGNNGTKAEVDPPHVSFEDGDQILVASAGKYVGTLTKTTEADGSKFRGGITDPTEGEPLYFYFLGNKIDVTTLTPGTTEECTVNISDQSNYPHLPVISMGKSTVNYTEGETSYSSRLYNKVSLMKFNVTTPSEAAICITGMNNVVTVDFGQPTEENYGFTYGMDAEDGGLIKMHAKDANNETWAIVLPQAALAEGEEGSIYSFDNSYIGTRPAIHAIEVNKFYNSGIAMTVSTHVWNGDLSVLTANDPEGFATATDGMTIYGTLAANVKVSIAAGATVTLDGVTINGVDNLSYQWAGITCEGNATINLLGTNIVKGFAPSYPGVFIPKNYTLTIDGTGSLNASSNGNAAGIGGDYSGYCGNITINGGVITATGGPNAAGIGGAFDCECGDILIQGGTVTATAGKNAAGIGCGGGEDATCGNITIENTVTLVTAVRGNGATYSIGEGKDGMCGTVTIGGTNYGTSGVTPNRPDGKTFVYPLPEGVINGLFSVSSTKQVYFSKGSLQYIGSASTPYWKFADNQWDLLSTTNQNTNNTNVDRDIFSWGTSGYPHGATFYQPWEHGSNNNQFYAYGDIANYLSASTGKADWGYNAISNGGNQEHLWYTLDKDEWTYLLINRPGSTVNGTDNARYARATVEGINGVILFPDIYTHPADVNQPNYINSNSGGWANTYTAADFMKMEAHGAVFLPAGGGYVGGNIYNRNAAVFYWSSQPDNNGNALGLYLNNNSINCANSMYRHLGIGVRLVRAAE